MVKEWCDAVLFANHETFAVKKSDRDRAKGVSNGTRIVHTQRRAAWDAGNRYGLPDTLPLSWDDFDIAVRAGAPATAEHLALDVNALLAEVDQATKKAALEWLGKNGNAKNATKLAQMADRLRAKIATQSPKEEVSHAG